MAKKKTEDELIDFTNKAINELVFPKYTLKKPIITITELEIQSNFDI